MIIYLILIRLVHESFLSFYIKFSTTHIHLLSNLALDSRAMRERAKKTTRNPSGSHDPL